MRFGDSPCLLGQIVVNDQRILAVVAEVFAHRATGVRRDELQRSRFGSRCHDDDGMFHRAVLFQFAYHVSNRRTFLADGDINTFDAGAFLVDDGIDGNRGFTGLAVTDDQLPLAAATGIIESIDFNPIWTGWSTD